MQENYFWLFQLEIAKNGFRASDHRNFFFEFNIFIFCQRLGCFVNIFNKKKNGLRVDHFQSSTWNDTTGILKSCKNIYLGIVNVNQNRLGTINIWCTY